MFRISLHAQLVWFFGASLYNGLSLAVIADGKPGFAGNEATTLAAQGAVVVFGIVTLVGYRGWIRRYYLFPLVVAVALFAQGVMKHVNLGPEGYASYGLWMTAIIINIFGTCAYGFGAYFGFRKRNPEHKCRML